MNLLELNDYAILSIINKLNLVDRINLSRTHTRLSPLCFEGSWQRKSTETLTLNELRHLYKQSRTENERDQLFKSHILDRLLIKNFNEVVHLYMDPRNKQLVTNDKILHSLKGKFVLEVDREKVSDIFVEQSLRLLEKVKGTFLYPKAVEPYRIERAQGVLINIGAPVEPRSVQVTPAQFRSLLACNQRRRNWY